MRIFVPWECELVRGGWLEREEQFAQANTLSEAADVDIFAFYLAKHEKQLGSSPSSAWCSRSRLGAAVVSTAHRDECELVKIWAFARFASFHTRASAWAIHAWAAICD